MRSIKKVLLILLTVIVFFLGVDLLFILGIGPTLNDAKAASIKDKLEEEFDVPEDTEIIEIVSYCDNTSGTGNHIEIWAGVLIHTELPDEDVRKYYENYGIERWDIWDVADTESTWMEEKGFSKFSFLSEGGDKENCYLIVDYYDAFTNWDIRAH